MGTRPSYLELRQLPWSAPRVCVIGDVMVDAYMWGHVHRMSPKPPFLSWKSKNEKNVWEALEMW